MREIYIMRLKKIHQLITSKAKEFVIDDELTDEIKLLRENVNDLYQKNEKLNRDMSIVVAAMKELYLNIEQLMLIAPLNQTFHYENSILNNDDEDESH